MNGKKTKLFLFFFLGLIPFFCFAQKNVILPKSNVLNDATANRNIKGGVLGKNLYGPKKVVFVDYQNDFKKNNSSTEEKNHFGVNKKKPSNTLAVVYSGRIYSPDINEDFIFENKTMSELSKMEIKVSPSVYGVPYTLYLDLETKIPTSLEANKFAIPAGEYSTQINIKLVDLEN
jgi:hypothetical protein